MGNEDFVLILPYHNTIPYRFCKVYIDLQFLHAQILSKNRAKTLRLEELRNPASDRPPRMTPDHYFGDPGRRYSPDDAVIVPKIA
jgi:hypothetical protein